MTPLIPYFKVVGIEVLGAFTLYTHGSLLAAGVFVGWWVAVRKARRDGLCTRLIVGFLPWVFAGLIIGGHVGELLLYQPRALLNDPTLLFRRDAGVSSIGALIAVGGLGAWYFRRAANGWAYADAIVYGAPLGWFIGRLGCFAVHDHPGTETRFWLGVYGICPSQDRAIACHDLGLYEALVALALFAGVSVLDRRRRFSGYFVMVLAFGYGFSRFLLDMLRHPLTDTRYLGLTPAQYGCIALVGLAAWLYACRGEQHGAG